MAPPKCMARLGDERGDEAGNRQISIKLFFFSPEVLFMSMVDILKGNLC